jgi:mannosylglycoprotein endo-beta-mannosidase
MRVFNAFWNLDFRSFNLLNEAMMVLLHKTNTPQGLKDYRPISLIHSISKLIAKGLANHLAPFMPTIVMPNQSVFIHGRQIHENFRAVQLTCQWLHARHHPTMLLKVDLAKAFDIVAWSFLLEVLTHIGFPHRWREWISALLGTASTKVLVNGRLRRHICHARGLR